jgi:hypothetical protein
VEKNFWGESEKESQGESGETKKMIVKQAV